MQVSEFMTLTPVYFKALCSERARRDHLSQDLTEYMLAQVIAKIHNTSLGGSRHPIAPRDVMPSQWKRKAHSEKQKTRMQRDKELTAQIRVSMQALTAFHGAKVVARK